MIRTVIFDIDNTLYDFWKTNRIALDAVSSYTQEQFGWTADRFEDAYKEIQDEMLDRMGMTGSCRSRILRFQGMLENAEIPIGAHPLRMYHLYWDTLLEAAVPEPGAAELLRQLKNRGLRIGIGTDMTAYMQYRKLEKLGMIDWVDFMVCSEEAGFEKPDPRFFARCLEKTGCTAAETLFIGDHPDKDVQGALHAGMKALWYHPGGKPGTGNAAEIRRFDEVISKLETFGWIPG